MSRTTYGFSRMMPGTMHGESRVATRAHLPTRISVSYAPDDPVCECLLWDSRFNDDNDIRTRFGPYYGGFAIANDRLYVTNFVEETMVSFPLTNALSETLELSNIALGYLTSDGAGRVWIDGTMEDDPIDPNGTWPVVIRPLDAPLDEDERLITLHQISGVDQVANTYYQRVTRWFGWHPGDGNFYHWQSWAMNPGSSPRLSQGRMYQITPEGTMTLMWTIQGEDDGYANIASSYRIWAPTSDGGLWSIYHDPADNSGPPFYSPGTHWLRRYDISDGSYTDFTNVGEMSGGLIWPHYSADDRLAFTTSHSDAWKTISSSGDIENYPACLIDSISMPMWSAMHDRVVMTGWDYDTNGGIYEGLFDLSGQCDGEFVQHNHSMSHLGETYFGSSGGLHSLAFLDDSIYVIRDGNIQQRALSALSTPNGFIGNSDTDVDYVAVGVYDDGLVGVVLDTSSDPGYLYGQLLTPELAPAGELFFIEASDLNKCFPAHIVQSSLGVFVVDFGFDEWGGVYEVVDYDTYTRITDPMDFEPQTSLTIDQSNGHIAVVGWSLTDSEYQLREWDGDDWSSISLGDGDHCQFVASVGPSDYILQFVDSEDFVYFGHLLNGGVQWGAPVVSVPVKPRRLWVSRVWVRPARVGLKIVENNWARIRIRKVRDRQFCRVAC